MTKPYTSKKQTIQRTKRGLSRTMTMRIYKRVRADSEKELSHHVKQSKQEGWNEGRTITVIGAIKPIMCHLWKDINYK